MFLLFSLLSIQTYSQSLFNADFDSICVCAIDRIYGWVTSDVYGINQDSVLPFSPNQIYTSTDFELHFAVNSVRVNYDQDDSIGYASSVKLFTKPEISFSSGEPLRGFITNGTHFYTDSSGLIDFSRGGTPFPYRPTHLTGMYKFEDSLSAVDDFGKVIILLKSHNTSTGNMDTVGYAESVNDLNPTNEWKPFSIPIQYSDTTTPDSIVLVFFSAVSGAAPTTLWIDSIGFEFSTTSIGEEEENIPLLYPNPANAWIHIPFKDDRHRSYRMYDANASEVKSGVLTRRLDVSSLPKGMYLLQVSEENEVVFSAKLMKL